LAAWKGVVAVLLQATQSVRLAFVCFIAIMTLLYDDISPLLFRMPGDADK
jgi:hypothetical protein